MKMKLLDRLILRFGALLTVLTGGISIAAGILLYGHDLGEGVVMGLLPLILIISGAVAVVVSFLIFLVARRYSSRRRAFVTQTTDLGELRIAVSAIENLILKCVETHKEVKVNEMNVVNHRDAIDVQMRVSINGNVSIPHAVEQLQSQIKRYLAASSGIEVRNISVSVDKAPITELEAPKDLPEPEVKVETPAEKKEKVPVHQRVFGRDPEKSEVEQMAEAEYVTPDPVEEAPAVEPAPETEEELPAEEAPVEEAPAEEPVTEEAEPAAEEAPAAEEPEEEKKDEQ